MVKIFQTIQTHVLVPFILKLCSKNLGAGQNKAYPIEIRTLEDIFYFDCKQFLKDRLHLHRCVNLAVCLHVNKFTRGENT